MTTEGVCSDFQQHAWKKELCANCQKTRTQHVRVPVPAKRTTVSTVPSQDLPNTTGVNGETEEGKPAAGSQDGTCGETRKLNDYESRSHSTRKHALSEAAENCDSAGEEGKPKPRPAIASKPSTLPKQASDEKPKTTDSISNGCEETEMPVGGDGEATMEDHGVFSEAAVPKQAVVMRRTTTARPDIAARARKSKSSRPMSPPPSAPGRPGKVESTYGERTAGEMHTDTDKNQKCVAGNGGKSSTNGGTGKGHFYHDYDVRGRGTLPSANAKRRKDTVPTQPYRVVDITGSAASAPVEPYIVVNVTSTLPVEPLDHPPKQPTSPAPDQENSGGSSGSSYSGSSLGSGRSRTTSEDSDKVTSLQRTDRSAAKPKRSIIQGPDFIRSSAWESPDAISANVSVGPHNPPQQLNEERHSPKPAQKVPIVNERYIVQHTYEEISLYGKSTQEHDDEYGFTRQTSSRASATKSAAFEAKIAALSSLSLGSCTKDGDTKQAENDCERNIPTKTPPTSRRLNCNLATSQDVKCDLRSPPAKSKKGPTSFFKKLLKIGSRSSSGSELDDSCRKMEEPDGRAISLDINTKESDLIGRMPQDSLARKKAGDNSGRTSIRRTSVPRLPEDLKQAIENASHVPNTSEPVQNISELVPKSSQPVPKTPEPVPSPRPRTDFASRQRKQTAKESSPSPHKTGQEDVAEVDPQDAVSNHEVTENKVYGTSAVVACVASAETTREDNPREDPGLELAAMTMETTEETAEYANDPEDGKGSVFLQEMMEMLERNEETDADGAVKMRTKSETAKTARRMRHAPPPPPPISSTLGPLDLPVSPPVSPPSPRGMFISAPIAVTGIVGAANTLPRLGSAQNGRRRVSSDDQQCSRRLNSVEKHARNKTVSEGIKLEDIPMGGRSNEDRMSRTFDPRVSKFFNRALPLPPTGEKIPEEGATEENEYEQVSPSQKERERKRAMERDSYEDIEDDIVDDSGIYSSPWDLNHSIEMMGLSSKQRDEIKKDFTVNGDTTDEPKSTLPRSVSTDYLEPVSQADVDCVVATTNGVVSTAARSDWYPHPAVKHSRQKPRKTQYSIAEPYVTMFADSGRILDKDRLAMNSREGFNKMCLCNLETLQLICEGMYIEFVNARTQFWKDARWRDFELVDDGRPEYVTGPLAFYRARSSRVATPECLLMIHCNSVNRDLLQCRHANVISPVAMFTDRVPAECFPDQHGDVETNVAVLNYHSVDSIDNYCREIALLYANDSDKYDRSVCYILAQILNALLYIHDRIHLVSSLRSHNVAVVAFGVDSKKRVIVNPTKGRGDLRQLCDDIVTLLTRDLLRDTASIPLTRYSKGFDEIVRVLKTGGDLEAVICARNMSEFMLWGPIKEDVEILSLAEQREQTFHVWLELVRCRCVNTLALERNAPSVEAADRLKFLCAVTGQSLYTTAKMLGL